MGNRAVLPQVSAACENWEHYEHSQQACAVIHLPQAYAVSARWEGCDTLY